MRSMAILAGVLLLGACAGHRVPRGGETIVYHRSGGDLCFAASSCPDYTITLGPDGQGIFTGVRGAMVGERRFRANPNQVSAFAAALQPFRPDGGRYMPEQGCGYPAGQRPTEFANGAETIDVRWQPALKSGDYLIVYTGCDPGKNAKMFKALDDAPSLLPVADLIGSGR